MKKVLFAVPALVFTLFLTFCQKADVQETTISANPDTGVTERAPCTIWVYSDNVHPITFCGTKTNLNTCSNICTNNQTLIGVEVVNGNGVPFVVNSNKFTVETASPGGSWINIVSATDQTGFTYIPANGCIVVAMDNGCNFL